MGDKIDASLKKRRHNAPKLLGFTFNQLTKKEISITNNINRIAIDLAKNIFQVCALNSHNKILFNKKLSRKKFIEFMTQIPDSTGIIGTE